MNNDLIAGIVALIFIVFYIIFWIMMGVVSLAIGSICSTYIGVSGCLWWIFTILIMFTLLVLIFGGMNAAITR